MTPAIQQRVTFNASPHQLFRLYMDSKQHSAATHGKAVVSQKAGGMFSAFDGMIKGKTLAMVPNRMIVQSWRAKHWSKADLDSILVLTFSKTKRGAHVDLLHANVPKHDHQGVTLGWESYYWKPWRAYLEQQVGKAGGK